MTFTITRKLHFQQGRRGRNKIKGGKTPKRLTTRTPHISRLMALAIHFQEMLNAGHVSDLATLARYGQVTRARITQIMNLLYLAPDIQEELLNLPQTTHDHDDITCGKLQTITLEPDWKIQRQKWIKTKTFCI
jgi:hypothetical protein